MAVPFNLEKEPKKRGEVPYGHVAFASYVRGDGRFITSQHSASARAVGKAVVAN